MDFVRMNYATRLNGAEHSKAWQDLTPEQQDEYNVFYKELYGIWMTVKAAPEWDPGKEAIKSFNGYAEKNPVSEELQGLFADFTIKN